jgi:2-succinyl-5-enolpyruvyl-6-hydroxy-3-cyclohexene-1-carboxylate synthase
MSAPNAEAAAALVAGLAGEGPFVAVISPGSRSTPLALALESDPRCRLHVVLDERAAAFVALGLGRATGQPAVVIGTSGSAAAHYLPAICEAHHARVPLIAISANRPPELWGHGAPQTMRQEGLFRGWVRLEGQLPVPDTAVDPRVFRRWGASARLAAMGSPPGPVHLDAPFREPLWSPGDAPAALAPLRALHGTLALAGEELDALADRLEGRRGLVIAGPAAPQHEGALLGAAAARFAERIGWPILVDAASGLRFGPFGPRRIASYDALCRHSAADALAPEVVLAVGLPPTSKPLHRFLAESGAEMVRLDADGLWLDPDELMALMVRADPAATLAALAARIERPTPPDWCDRWLMRDAAATKILTAHAREGWWSGRIATTAVDALPNGSLLHLASSMPLREVDAFATTSDRSIAVHASRGVNGIDGTLATLLGESLAQGSAPSLGLVGDLALLHDLDGLEAFGCLEASATVVVVDNGGGGIFSYLPIAAHPAFERLFLTPRLADVCEVSRALGARAVRVDDPLGLSRALAEAVPRAGLDVVVATIDREHDVARHAAAFAAVAEVFEGSAA